MELVRCSRRNIKGYGCQNLFHPEFRKQKGVMVPILRCPTCRSKGSTQQKKPAVKAVTKEWRGTATGQEYRKVRV